MLLNDYQFSYKFLTATEVEVMYNQPFEVIL